MQSTTLALPSEPLALEDLKVPIQFKLSALWTSVTLCYLYGDYFGLYKPGTLQSMLDGMMGPLGHTTQAVLVGTSILMAIPSLMVLLSLLLWPRINRWANIVFGIAYTIIMLVSMPGAWAFYQMLGGIEIALTTSVAWQAWNWPRKAVQA